MAGSHSKLPKFADITQSINIVVKAEHSFDPKSDRFRQVALLSTINEVVTEKTPNAVQIKLGMLLWLHLAIRYREYKGKEPYWVFREIRNPLTGKVLIEEQVYGSQVCYVAEQRLKAHLVVLAERSSRDNFVYLAAFKEFLTSHPPKEGSNQKVDQLIDEVIDDLKLEYTAKPKQKEMVDRLLSRYPAPWFLHKEFDGLYEAYKKYYNEKGIVGNAFHDPFRDQLVFFMCAANLRLGKQSNPDTREDRAYRIKLAIAIFVMHEVKKTYNVLPVDWSELHRLCGSISNLSSIDALNYEEQLDHLILLRQFLRDEIKHKTARELEREWAPLTTPSTFLHNKEERISAIMAEIEVKKRSAPAPKPSGLETVVAVAKKVPGAVQAALIPEASKAVFGGPLAYVGNRTGQYFAGAAGAWAGAKIGSSLGAIILPVDTTKQALENAIAENAFEAADRRIKAANADQPDPRHDEKRELTPRDTGNYNDAELRDALLTLLPEKEPAIRKSFDMPLVSHNSWNMVVVAGAADLKGSQASKPSRVSSIKIEEVHDDVAADALVHVPAASAAALARAAAPSADAKAKIKPKPSPHVALALMPPVSDGKKQAKSKSSAASAAEVEGAPASHPAPSPIALK